MPKQQSSDGDGPGGIISVTRLMTKQELSADVETSARMFEVIGPQPELAMVRLWLILMLQKCANNDIP